MQLYPKERRTIFVQISLTTTAFAQRPMCARGAPISLQVTVLRGYGDLTATPLRSYLNAERRLLKVRAVVRSSMRGPTTGDATALLR